ncbi:MAG: GTPase Era [Oscillospiraceae bacterium]|nr:GTPase Era [Oscillospiraceae bacterium]
MQENTQTKSLFAAIVGKPNVGKSSLLNKLVGEKVAIVTSKPQTTRTKVTGILTKGVTQFIFLDTPGIHKARTKLGERMVKTSTQSVADVDVVLMVFEPYGELTEAELLLIEGIKAQKVPAIAAINKIDTLKKEADLDDRMAFIKALQAFDCIKTISVAEDKNVSDLLDKLGEYAVESPHFFPEDSYTDLPEKALVAEIVREKMLLNLYDEIPHGTAVTVERFKERPDKDIIDIDINIYCEKKSHKGMIIGKGGQMLKKIASAARLECEEFLGTRVNLQCWVKIKDDWRDNDFLLNNFGFKTE